MTEVRRVSAMNRRERGVEVERETSHEKGMLKGWGRGRGGREED
jgi:hypothetical protein